MSEEGGNEMLWSEADVAWYVMRNLESRSLTPYGLMEKMN
jgi:hypothetical protein